MSYVSCPSYFWERLDEETKNHVLTSFDVLAISDSCGDIIKFEAGTPCVNFDHVESILDNIFSAMQSEGVKFSFFEVFRVYNAALEAFHAPATTIFFSGEYFNADVRYMELFRGKVGFRITFDLANFGEEI